MAPKANSVLNFFSVFFSLVDLILIIYLNIKIYSIINIPINNEIDEITVLK
jgi:hypothetical protein